MKHKIRPFHIAAVSLNAAAVIGIIICSSVGNSIIGRQSSDHSFEKWKGDSDDTFAQVSCFFSDDADFKKDRVNSVSASLTEKLVNAAYETEEGKKLFADAYSAALDTMLNEMSAAGLKQRSLLTAETFSYSMISDF